MARLELFHRIAEPDSAKVRRYLTTQGLAERVWFRNVHYPEASSALLGLGGGVTPALWDGERLFVGADAVLARLEQLG